MEEVYESVDENNRGGNDVEPFLSCGYVWRKQQCRPSQQNDKAARRKDGGVYHQSRNWAEED